MNDQLNTPILFIVFNRPETTSKVFEVIKKVRPKRFYIAADGARLDKNDELKKVELVRKIATSVDWPCEVKTLFSDFNLGMKIAESKAMTWFFENEKEGIILEDDTLPHLDFFLFCELLLNKYRDNKKVLTISGANFQNKSKRGLNSYYCSKYFHGWGWASWRRTWNLYDEKIKFWPNWKNSTEWVNKCPDKIERRYWTKIFDKVYENKIDTWDYQFVASLWYKGKGGFNLTPNTNLITNIGFGKIATHTTNFTDRRSLIPIKSIGDITHPKNLRQCLVADKYSFDNVFGGWKLRLPWSLFYLIIRILKFCFKKFKLLLIKD